MNPRELWWCGSRVGFLKSCAVGGRRMLTPESFITALINRAIVSYCKLNLCHPEILKLGRFKYSANTCLVMGKNEKCQSLINDIEDFGQRRAECLMLPPWTWGVSVVHPRNELGAGGKSCNRGTFHFQQHPIEMEWEELVFCRLLGVLDLFFLLFSQTNSWNGD